MNFVQKRLGKAAGNAYFGVFSGCSQRFFVLQRADYQAAAKNMKKNFARVLTVMEKAVSLHPQSRTERTVRGVVVAEVL